MAIITKANQAIGKTLGQVQGFTSGVFDYISPVTTSYVNKAWRAMVLVHRATHYPQDVLSKENKNEIPGKGENLLTKYDEREKAKLEKAKSMYPNSPNGINTIEHDIWVERKTKPENTPNKVILYNLTSKPYEYIILQNRPNTLDFKGETSWAAIKSMGRNTPMYHYTGAEDIIQFNISWYCDDPDHLDEVVNKCRFLEAWTKANGYAASPPIIRIEWGASDIFKDQTFILTSATYTLANFNDYALKVWKEDSNNGELKRSTRDVKNCKLLPSTATQELIFKRVSATNLSWNDILPEDKMKYTRGLNKA